MAKVSVLVDLEFVSIILVECLRMSDPAVAFFTHSLLSSSLSSVVIFVVVLAAIAAVAVVVVVVMTGLKYSAVASHALIVIVCSYIQIICSLW